MPRRVTPEGALLRTVTDLLTAERVWWMRCNSGLHILRDESGKKRAFRGHRPGTADILTVRRVALNSLYPLFVPTWLELKAPRGVQSQLQKEFQATVEAHGHTYLLIRDVDQVVAWLREGARA